VRRRFFVDRFSGTTALLEGNTAHHLAHVLRAQTGQLYELSDGSIAWLARIESVARNRIAFTLLEQLPALPPIADVTLLISIVKFDSFEWGLEKATELGVSNIIPLAAARSEKNLLFAAGKRSGRWRKILLESAQQCRRLSVPHLAEPCKPAPAFSAQNERFCVLLSERPDAPPIPQVLAANTAKSKAFALAFGPEGGWTDDELASARSSGFHEASLGPHILRAETAVISALSIVNFVFSQLP